jgi:hypothetical protein
MIAEYLLALCLTIAVEAGVAYLLGLRTRWHMLAVAAMNTVTHPVLIFFLLVLGSLGWDVTRGMIVLLEMLVVVVEWRLLVYIFIFPRGGLFLASLLMNAASFMVGILLFWPH